MTFLRTKGTGNFKVTKKSTGAYLRCRYDASEKAENETPPAENETSSIAAYLTDSTIGTPIIHIDAQSGNKGGYTIPHDVVTEDGILSWNCGEHWVGNPPADNHDSAPVSGVFNTDNPIALTGASMTISFWVKPYGSGNSNMYDTPGEIRFMFKGWYWNENYTTFRRGYLSGGNWFTSDRSDLPVATTNEWVNVTLVYNGNQVTTYMIPLNYDISQGLIENIHYRTDTISTAFSDVPITHIVGHSGNSHSGRVYLANTSAWNNQLTLEQVESLFTMTKPSLNV